MDNRMRASLDNYIAGGHYYKTEAGCECKKCGYNFQWTLCWEYGTSWYEPEEVKCPECGADFEEDD